VLGLVRILKGTAALVLPAAEPALARVQDAIETADGWRGVLGRIGDRAPVTLDGALDAAMRSAAAAFGPDALSDDRTRDMENLLLLTMPEPGDFVGRGLDGSAMAAAMLARLPALRAAGKIDPVFPRPGVEQVFVAVVTAALDRLAREPAFFAALGPEVGIETLRRLERIGGDTAALREASASHTEMLRELLARATPSLPIETARAILAEFGALHDGELDPAAAERLLREKAEEYKALRARLSERDNAGDLTLRDLQAEARALIDAGRFDAADDALVAAERHADRARARTRESRGDLAMLRLRYREAAAHFLTAAGIVPEVDRAGRLSLVLKAEHAEYLLGSEFGDRDALLRAVAILQEQALGLAPRAAMPLDWAATQNNLGNVHSALARMLGLPEDMAGAVAAYRAALEERPREQVPLAWARTQNNLGLALFDLARMSGRAEDMAGAVAAYRAALEELTRERVPLDWAMTQNNLGGALDELARMSGRAEDMAGAVAAYRAALEERTRERVPLDWARTQNNLGTSLAYLALMSGLPEDMAGAVAAYRAALEEWTQERVPLDWAGTQNNLGNALADLALMTGRAEDTAGAVAAYRAALEERTRERVPLDWAATRHNQAGAHLWLFRQHRDPADWQAARAAAADAVAVYRDLGHAGYLPKAEARLAGIEAARPPP
jgi:hypothetical protein